MMQKKVDSIAKVKAKESGKTDKEKVKKKGGNNMKLTPRLEAIAEMVRGYDCLADVGTDHGYLPIALIETNGIQRAIASDVNEAPLENARSAVFEAGLEESIELRLGSGLEPYQVGDADVFVLAGMGGQLMCTLLDSGQQVARSASCLVLQPMQAQAELRVWLSENGYNIEEACIAREGEKFYEIMKVVTGQMDKLTWTQQNLGVNVHVDENYREFLAYKKRVQEKIIGGLEIGKREEALAEARQVLGLIEGAIEAVSKGENHAGKCT